MIRVASSKSCGDCHACCVELNIDTPEFQKKGQTPCPHLSAGRCGIYHKRPQICREFLCGYLLFPELDESWRPDRSGIVILQVAQASLPKPYQQAGHGIQLLVTGGEAAILRPGFVDYVFGLVRAQVGVYLTAMIPRAMLNQYLEPFVAAGDFEGDTAHLTACLPAPHRQWKTPGFSEASAAPLWLGAGEASAPVETQAKTVG